MARPTKWSKEIEEQAYDYIRDYGNHGHMIPSIEGLAIVLDLHRDTLYDWAKHKDKKFSDILGKLLQMQQQFCLNATFLRFNLYHLAMQDYKLTAITMVKYYGLISKVRTSIYLPDFCSMSDDEVLSS